MPDKTGLTLGLTVVLQGYLRKEVGTGGATPNFGLTEEIAAGGESTLHSWAGDGFDCHVSATYYQEFTNTTTQNYRWRVRYRYSDHKNDDHIINPNPSDGPPFEDQLTGLMYARIEIVA